MNNETLYPHEWLLSILHNRVNHHPEMFRSFCYFIFPVLTLTSDIIITNHINIYMKINNIEEIENQLFIVSGLNISALIALLLLTLGFIQIISELKRHG